MSIAIAAMIGFRPLPHHEAGEAPALGEVHATNAMELALAGATGTSWRSAPSAAHETRRIMLAATSQPDEVGWRLSHEVMLKVFGNEDFDEGQAAFVQKPAPRWRGVDRNPAARVCRWSGRPGSGCYSSRAVKPTT